jgi:hypothetical protein
MSEETPPTTPPKNTTQEPEDSFKGWPSREVYDRFRETRSELGTLKERLASIQGELEAATSAKTAAEQRAEQIAAESTRKVTAMERRFEMERLGGNLAAPSVQRLFLREYEEYAAEAGAEATPFGEWLTSEAVKTDPLFAAHFPQPGDPAPAQPAGPAAQAPTTPAPNAVPQPPAPQATNPNGGTQPGSAAHTGRYTASQIAEYQKSPALWRKHREAILAQVTTEGPPK